ncbi:MAG: histidine kinase [Pseudomonadota bacterium]
MATPEIRLTQHLPAEVVAGNPGWWLSYKRYPVFSWPWVWRRGLLFSLFVVAWAALSGISHYADGGTTPESLAMAGWMVFGFGTIINAGPLLACLVRHRNWSMQREHWGVMVAMFLGLVLAYNADMVGSARLMAISGESFERGVSGMALVINWLVLIVIYLLLGGGLALRAYFSEGRRLADFQQREAMAGLEAEKLASDQQLALLQAQIEPHFLFNTLATIRSEVRRSPDQAEETLDALCDYLRSTIPRLRDDEAGSLSTLGEQFDICRHYLKVMQGRMRERLTYEIALDPDLASHPFPPFLLLSLVENAIRHGIEPKAEGGEIKFESTRDGGLLCVRVVDSGVGLGAAVGHGVGLSNIRHQLKLRYGDAGRLSLASSPEGGVEATIRLPWEGPQ